MSAAGLLLALPIHPRRQDDELEVRTAGQGEGDLFIAQPALARVIEAALAAGALLDLMLPPAAREHRAALPQPLDQPLELGIVEIPARVGAELRQHPARP